MATYYKKDGIYINGYPAEYSFGVNISNLGSKVSYNSTDEYFLPANLKIGSALEIEIDDYNTVSAIFDINKLLVPTPTEEGSDDIGSLEGAIKSFSDAPGGFKEEMQEIMLSVGLEYVYDQSFSLRGGYFHEHENKGNRKFFSVGAGFEMNVFALDVSYLVPVSASSPLGNTLRFSLSFGVDGLQNLMGN